MTASHEEIQKTTEAVACRTALYCNWAHFEQFLKLLVSLTYCSFSFLLLNILLYFSRTKKKKKITWQSLFVVLDDYTIFCSKYKIQHVLFAFILNGFNVQHLTQNILFKIIFSLMYFLFIQQLLFIRPKKKFDFNFWDFTHSPEKYWSYDY